MSDDTKKAADGGPAFPAEGGFDSGLSPTPGMSLRDWFAGMALQGILASPANSTAAAKAKLSVSAFRECCADGAFKVADAMIERRKK